MKNKKLFRPEDALLPRNRFAQLGNILRHHFFEVMLASMYTLIFAIPLVIWLVFTSYVSMFQDNYLLNILFVYGILALFITLMGLGMGGGLYFFKRLLYQEGGMIHQDFFIGVKKNARMFSLIYFVLGLLYLFLHIGLGAVKATTINEYAKAVLMGVMYALFFLLVFLSFFMQSETICFEGEYISLLKWSIRFVFPTLYKGIGIYALILIPFLLIEFIPRLIVLFVALAFTGLFWFGFSELILMQFSFHVYDLSVNKTQYPQNYRKGLAKEIRPGKES